MQLVSEWRYLFQVYWGTVCMCVQLKLGLDLEGMVQKHKSARNPSTREPSSDNFGRIKFPSLQSWDPPRAYTIYGPRGPTTKRARWLGHFSVALGLRMWSARRRNYACDSANQPCQILWNRKSTPKAILRNTKAILWKKTKTSRITKIIKLNPENERKTNRNRRSAKLK